MNTIKQMSSAAQSAGREIAEDIRTVHGPIWEMRLELVKLVISLCSAILVATITLSETLIGESLCPAEKSVLLVSWGFLLASLLLCLGCFYAHTQLGSFHARFHNMSPKFEKLVSRLDTNSPNYQDDAEAILKEISDNALNPIGVADAWARWLSTVAYGFFALGIIGFFVFGGLRI